MGLSKFTVGRKDSGRVRLDGLTKIQQSNVNYANQTPENNLALILHTSGTTSQPKRVPLSHGNLISSINHIIDTYGLSEQDVSLCVMPLFHVHGLVASTLSTLLSGGTVILPEKFNIATFWTTVKKYDVTWFSAVPTIHQSVIGRLRRNNESIKPNALRFIRSCSASIANRTLMDMEQIFEVPVLEAYGMTEAAHQMTSNPLPPERRVIGSVGKATGLSVAIMDEIGNFVPTGSPGEIVIKGPNVIDGYEGNSEANAASFSSGWFRTGDQGILDDNGYLTIIGRIKEFINRSGEKISPKEIDDILLQYPGVKEAVSFGLPNDVHGEVPAAAVVVHDNVTESDLIQHCRNHMAVFKCPRKIYIVSSIPKTPTGKVQRRIVAAGIKGLYK
jgi:acyl-CoA synthetase (AMP-forming)/AMP-acid ligase II